ncbi:unnamed protein product [Ectocarpus fasciculatus]
MSTIVLVTGGTGLVGKAIEEFVSRDPDSEGQTWFFAGSKDADLTNRESTFALFDRVKPTHVIHLAAKVGGLFSNLSQKVEFYRENTYINDNVYEACRIHGVVKMVSCLSTCIFPDKTSYPIDETMIHDGAPHSSNEGYAYAKRMLDVMNRCYKEEYGCNFTSIIPTNVYGPHDNFCIEGGHVIPGLIHKCYIAKQTGADFVIWGSGSPLRQFIYSGDLAALTVKVMRHWDSADPIILSVGEEDEVSIGDVARLVAEKMGFTGNIVFDTSKSDGQHKKTANNRRLRDFLPDYKFTSLEQGIDRSCAWFSANYTTARK